MIGIGIGLTGDDNDVTDDDENDTEETEVEVEYEVVEDAKLSVRVEGAEKSYDINLYDPNGETVGTGYITSDEMVTGHETVEVYMTDDLYENPISGEYRLIVKESASDEKVFEEKPTFDGPDIEITDVKLETEYDDTLDEWDITGIRVDVNNDGDLPIFADEMDLTIGDETEDISIYDEELIANGTTELDYSLYILDMEGTHSLSLELYSEEERFDTYQTDVTIGD